MSGMELIVVVVFGLIGYWIVSYLIRDKAEGRRKQDGVDTPEEPK
jgi:hypothetical protein